ncbi:hypothetical protein [Kibdelosporangium philippinense]|uniref:hypothetical protein n=1 Tax=Kibdelosporangium philippinense TaxID=211113 RepID=UPI0036181FCD
MGGIGGTRGLRAGRASGVVTMVMIMVTACTGTTSPEPAPAPGIVDPTAPVSATGTSPSGPASPVDRARRQAIAAYLGMWQDMAAAATTSDHQAPRLRDHAVEPALGVITRSLHADNLNGVVTKGAPRNQPTVSSMEPKEDPTTVMISDCGDSSDWLKYKKDGQLLNAEPGGRQSITAEVKRQPSGAWMVTRFAVMGVGTC